jgi:hypothetical protein
MTPQESAASYAELGVPELVKKVNEVYEQIHLHDRTNYPRAVMIGEMLNDIRPRVAKHGAWQNWLREHCPKISYETANIYMRIATKQNIILAEAGRKNVAATDLTIALARELLTKPRKPEPEPEPESGDEIDGEDEESDDSGGEGVVRKAAAIALAPDTVVRDLELEAGDMYEILKSIYDKEDLLVITNRLAAHLGMTLAPKPTATPQIVAPAAIVAPALGASTLRRV